MLTSIPVLAIELGFNYESYKELARNIKKIKNLSLESRQNILDRANKELSAKLRTKAHPLIESMAYDRELYKIAELSYSKGPPEGKGLFVTALADYLLKHPNQFRFIP